MNIFLKSDEFNSWLINLKDRVAKAKIALRIERASKGGDKSTQKRDIKRAIAMALTLPKD